MMSPGEKMVWAAAYALCLRERQAPLRGWGEEAYRIAARDAARMVETLRDARGGIEKGCDDLTRRMYLEMVGTELDSLTDSRDENKGADDDQDLPLQ